MVFSPPVGAARWTPRLAAMLATLQIADLLLERGERRVDRVRGGLVEA